MDLKYLALIISICFAGSSKGTRIGQCLFFSCPNVLEGEHVQLKCRLCNGSTPLDMNDLQAHGYNITWFKYTPQGDRVKLKLGKEFRITSDGTSIGFWPAMINDTGKYSCSLFNMTHHIIHEDVSLVVSKNEELCLNNVHHVSGYSGSSITLECPKIEYYNYHKEDIVWLKDFKEKVYTGTQYTIPSLEEKSAGCYTCVLSIENDGIQYNITETRRLTVDENFELLLPKLIYPQSHTKIDVELGKYKIIECQAVVDYKTSPKDDNCMLYWIFDNNFGNCNGTNTICEDPERVVTEDNRKIIIRPLVFKRIEGEHLNKSFHCALVCTSGQDIGDVILIEKEKYNIGKVLCPIILTMAIFIVVAVMCIKLKIYFVLCLRDLTGRDETLGDSKEYDAYVLLLKSGKTLDSAEEEQRFALELLPAVLEQRFGYRLCIFERDVPPGGACVENVLSNINKCRRLIIILCDESVTEKDSTIYELMTGLHQALVESVIKIILIEYNPIRNITVLPESLQLVLRSNRAVKWKKSMSLSHNSYFWKKIRYLMPTKRGKSFQFSQHGRSIY
ncbi:interleukin-18 receptor 1 [Callorhinchus milii]|uniref:interleukin-18 receptor 1 n=1 Tax=Callorhinchus milii TaxID=7868 RepID=UPI001C3FEDD4|nr:interleukin-18 receptor 1 [Callorhinchus milii]